MHPKTLERIRRRMNSARQASKRAKWQHIRDRNQGKAEAYRFVLDLLTGVADRNSRHSDQH